jgi:hypothetical protein
LERTGAKERQGSGSSKHVKAASAARACFASMLIFVKMSTEAILYFTAFGSKIHQAQQAYGKKARRGGHQRTNDTGI